MRKGARRERSRAVPTRCGCRANGRGGPALPSLVADDAALLRPERAALAPEELQVGERLVGGRHHLEAVVGADGEGAERHLVGRERPAADQVEHGELPHAMEVDQLPRAAAMVLVDAAVRWTYEPGLGALDLLVRGEEVAEG